MIASGGMSHYPGTSRYYLPAYDFDRWCIYELENSRDDDRVAYSLWKVLCLRTRLRVVFAYRGDWDEAGTLTARLSAEVVGPVPLIQRSQLTGETLFVVGSRGEADTFPWSYFKVWELDPDRGTFERV